MSFTIKQSSDGWNTTPTGQTSLLESVANPEDKLEQNNLTDPTKDPNDLTKQIDNPSKEGSLLEKTKDESKTDSPENKNDDSSVIVDDKLKEVLNSLAEEGVISLYEDYEIKSASDLKSLIKDNIQDKLNEVNNNIFQETIQQLPPQFQSVINYGLSGGTDVQSLLQEWSNVERTFNADVSTEEGKEAIVREFLELSNYGTKEMIEEDIKTWKDLGKLDDKVNLYKPKLEQFYMEKVAAKEKEAEVFNQQKQSFFENYTNAVGQVLAKEDLNGIKLDNKTKQFIYENTYPRYVSRITNEPIDTLQAIVEELKFGENKNPEAYAEILYFATNREQYKEMLKQQIKNEVVLETEKKTRKLVKNQFSGHTDDSKSPQNRSIKNDNSRWF